MNALFASDNVTSACPEVMDAVIAANSGIAESYGDDQWSSRLQTKLSEIFETDVIVFPAVTGTASNALALSVLTPTRSWKCACSTACCCKYYSVM
jgi:threonine aldolase